MSREADMLNACDLVDTLARADDREERLRLIVEDRRAEHLAALREAREAIAAELCWPGPNTTEAECAFANARINDCVAALDRLIADAEQEGE